MKKIKDQIREELKARRQKLSGEEREKASLLVMSHFQNCFSLARDNVISGYLPIQSELDIRPLLGVLQEKGYTTCLPSVTEHELVFKKWREGDKVNSAGFGLSEPLGKAEDVVPTHLLIPLLGFDAKGTRLGYGQGHYDKTLEKLRKKNRVAVIGVGYACQFYQDLPSEPHDQRLEFMITEEGVKVF